MMKKLVMLTAVVVVNACGKTPKKDVIKTIQKN